MNCKFPVLFAAALASGCLDEGLELETDDSEIIGGTPTTMRPEVGQFQHFDAAPGFMSTCTATLIAPRIILTAAHCLDGVFPQATPVAVPTGARFRFTDAGGTVRFVGVDRVHSFGLETFARPVNTSSLTQDVAIARLVTAIPASQATPATIATQEATIGTTSTYFGFGCTDLIFQGGGGTKRVITFVYGSSAASCPGDSGGPQMFGAAPGGAIWGVNTGGDLGGDVFANVVLYKKAIEDQMRTWLGGDEIGFDRLGFDYAANLTINAGACRLLCENDPNCRAFTFRASDLHCWRKSAAGEPTPVDGLVSGLPRRLEPGVDRFGADIGWVTATTPEECSVRCAGHPSCEAWTHLGTQCFFKSAGSQVSSQCPSCTSGVPRRGMEPNVDRPGFDFASFGGVASAYECQTRCAKDWRCEAWTHSGNSCFLKDGVPNAVSVSPGLFITSGVRRGVENQSDRPGGDFWTFTTPTGAPTFCQSMCAQNASCVAWSQKFLASGSQCSLKSTVTGRAFSVDTISGLKGLEMLP
jgi:hypothetical protein